MDDKWALSVTELNEYVRRKLAGDPVLRAVAVRGEVSGFKRYTSGHCYFALKDETSRVQCVLWRQQAAQLDFPARGRHARHRARRGLCVRAERQLSALRQRHGTARALGDLYLRFEALKKKLAAEGLFDPARKRELPLLAQSDRRGHLALGRGHPRHHSRLQAARPQRGRAARPLRGAGRGRGGGDRARHWAPRTKTGGRT